MSVEADPLLYGAEDKLQVSKCSSNLPDTISTPGSVPVTQKGFNCALGVLWGGRGADLR